MVKKKILEAGLGDVHVAKLDAGIGGEIGDFRNQRTAAIGVEVGAVAVGSADFPHAGEALETLQKLRGVYAEAKAQQVPTGNGSFQLLRSSKSDDAAVINNREAFAERVGFFHVVGGQQNCFAALIVFANDFPQEQAGLRVEASTGFVEKKNLRVMHHGARDGKALHHAAGKAADHLVGAIGEFETLQEGCRALGAFLRGEAEIRAVKSEDFASGEGKIQIGALGHDADEALDGDLRLPDVVFADKRLAAGGANAGSENADGSGLAGAVRAKETENFSGENVEGNSVKRDNFRLGLLALGFGLWRAKGETARASGHGWSGGKDLAKVHGANARYHAGEAP